MISLMLDAKKENNYLESLKNAGNLDFCSFSLGSLQEFLHEREDKLVKIILDHLLEGNGLAKKTIIEAVEKGTHRLSFDFDYSQFNNDSRIEIEVGLAPISDLFAEMDGDSFEKYRCFSKSFKTFLTDDECYFVDRRIDTAQTLLSETFYTDFDHFLGIFLNNDLFTQLSLKLRVVENFLRDHWLPFLNADGSIKKDEYIAKINLMVAEHRWMMPLDIDWDIEKTKKFVGFLTEMRYFEVSDDEYADTRRVQTGILFSELFDDCDGHTIDEDDQIPSCVLSFYFFAEIFGLNIENSRRLVFDDGYNLIKHRLTFDDEGNEIEVYGKSLLDTTSFKPTGVNNVEFVSEFNQLCSSNIESDIVHNIIGDRSLDFDSLLDRDYSSEIAFEGRAIWEDEFDFEGNTRDEYVLVVSDF